MPPLPLPGESRPRVSVLEAFLAIATDHRAGTKSRWTKEIADFEVGQRALKPT